MDISCILQISDELKVYLVVYNGLGEPCRPDVGTVNNNKISERLADCPIAYYTMTVEGLLADCIEDEIDAD